MVMAKAKSNIRKDFKDLKQYKHKSGTEKRAEKRKRELEISGCDPKQRKLFDVGRLCIADGDESTSSYAVPFVSKLSTGPSNIAKCFKILDGPVELLK